MQPFRIMAVFGTRPEGVKMAPLISEIHKNQDLFDLTVTVTGQHREMLDQILEAFNIQPDFDLDIMKPGQTLAQITSRALEGLDRVIESQKPDLILAQGDTTTTYVASLASYYRKVHFGHVEAGLRSGNRWEPFPEELNRRMTAICSTMHFAPTSRARQNLLDEGVPEDDIWLTGNTVIDALIAIASRDGQLLDVDLDKTLSSKRLILVTAHRRENWGQPMEDICDAVAEIIEKTRDSCVVFSMHKNPIVRDTVISRLGGKKGIYLIEPPDYLEFVKLMKKSYLILTDSGGVQEEAPSLGKPVLVLRNTTERPEGIEAGNAILVGTDRQNIVKETLRLMENTEQYNEMAESHNPYGDGNASKAIVNAIIERFGLN